MSSKIRYEKDTDNIPAVHADVDHGAVNTEKEDNLNLGLVQQSSDVAEEMKLDDARRVKAVSPGLLVVKRFFRNKLALVGLSILIILFLFCFLGAAVYPYSQSETFATLQNLEVDYAFAKINNDFLNLPVVDSTEMPSMTMQNFMNSYIKTVNRNGDTSLVVYDENNGNSRYIVTKYNDMLFSLDFDDYVTVVALYNIEEVGTYSAQKRSIEFKLNRADSALVKALEDAFKDKNFKVDQVSVEYEGNTYTLKNEKVVCTYSTLTENTSKRYKDIDDDFVTTVRANLDVDSFTLDGVTYNVNRDLSGNNDGYNITVLKNYVVLYSTTLSFDRYDITSTLSDDFRIGALAAISAFDLADPSTLSFTVGGKTYSIAQGDENFTISFGSQPYVYLSKYSIRRYTGDDTISVATKLAFRQVMDAMLVAGKATDDVTVRMESLDENGDYVYDDNGVLQFADEEFYVKTEQKGLSQQFVFRNVQEKIVADIYAKPSKTHILGLDANAMDVLARIMYGGRISLLIGFIVVIIEIILGSIMGGISGYFGGVVDNIIMRLVDIFYCIPTMPILIILGSMFDAINLDNTLRVIYMMMVLGFLGWPGIARLVRGQILSLREQDFMIAAEASGLTARRKIARHLIPNVIPQLIVQATMGLGGVILTESTLSFLGLGVKYPMATWGQIINSVSSVNAMQMYTYIWIPVGALICLAVIAFNFVGDGLRDAFDPKMSR